MSDVVVVFDADTQRFRANVDAAGQSVSKSADAIAAAKNKILDAFNQQVESAKKTGTSAEQLASIQTRAAQQMANVTDTNANRVINSLDRIATKQKAVASELANLKVPEVPETSDVSNRQRASALLRGGGLRAAENFASQFAAFNQIASVAFPILGAVTFGAELVRMGEAGYEAYKKIQDGAKLTAQQFDELHDKAQTRIDDLAIENQHIQDQIDKLSGHPNNGLADALLEAKKYADALINSLQEDRHQLEALLKEHDTGMLGGVLSSLGFGPTTTGTQKDELLKDQQDLLTQVKTARNNYNAAMTAAPDNNAREAATKAYNEAIKKDFQSQIDTYKTELGRLQKLAATPILTPTRNGFVESHVENAPQQENIKGRIQQLQDALSVEMLDESIYAGTNTLGGVKQGRELGSEANKAAEQQLKQMEAYVNVWKTLAPVTSKAIYDYWDAQRNAFTVGSNEYNTILAKQAEIAEEGARKAHEAISKFKESQNKNDGNLFKVDNKNFSIFGNTQESAVSLQRTNANRNLSQTEDDAQIAKTRVQIDLATGAISQLQAAQQTAAIDADLHAKRLADLNAQLEQLKKTSTSYNSLTNTFGSDKDQQQAVEIQTRIAKETAAATVDVMKTASEEAAHNWETALSNANAQWAQNARDTAAQVVAFYHQAIDGLNDNLSNLMIGKKANWSGYFQELSKTLATDSLKQMEGSILGKFGIHGKPDGTKSKPFAVTIVGQGGSGGSGGIGSMITGGASGGGDAASGGDADGDGASGLGGGGAAAASLGFLGTLGKFATSLFGGGMAVGGGVSSGTTYLVGEAGPELFSPKTSGTIIPNHALGGHSVNYSVQVANGVTPEQMKMHVKEALRQYHPHAVAASVSAMHDAQRRNPSHR